MTACGASLLAHIWVCDDSIPRVMLELIMKRGRCVDDDRFYAKPGPRELVYAKERERRVRGAERIVGVARRADA
jgi:hypothetical protein